MVFATSVAPAPLAFVGHSERRILSVAIFARRARSSATRPRWSRPRAHRSACRLCVVAAVPTRRRSKPVAACPVVALRVVRSPAARQIHRGWADGRRRQHRTWACVSACVRRRGPMPGSALRVVRGPATWQKHTGVDGRPSRRGPAYRPALRALQADRVWVLHSTPETPATLSLASPSE